MRNKTFFGALLLSAALCSQGFSFELLDRMLGLNNGGGDGCNACANVASAKACCPRPRLVETLVAAYRLGLWAGWLRHEPKVSSHPGTRPVRRHGGLVRGQGLR